LPAGKSFPTFHDPSLKAVFSYHRLGALDVGAELDDGERVELLDPDPFPPPPFAVAGALLSPAPQPAIGMAMMTTTARAAHHRLSLYQGREPLAFALAAAASGSGLFSGSAPGCVVAAAALPVLSGAGSRSVHCEPSHQRALPSASGYPRVMFRTRFSRVSSMC
jgi:hypothetical protein